MEADVDAEPPGALGRPRPTDAAGGADRRSTCRSARCSTTTRPRSATSGWTPGSARPRRGRLHRPRRAGPPAMVILLSEGAAADAAARDRLGRRGQPAAHRHGAGPRRPRARTSAGWAGSSEPRTTTRSPRTTGCSRPGSRWPTTARPRRRPKPQRILDEVQLATLPPAGRAVRARTTSTTGSTRCGPGWRGCGRCPGRVATTGPAGGPSWCPGC